MATVARGQTAAWYSSGHPAAARRGKRLKAAPAAPRPAHPAPGSALAARPARPRRPALRSRLSDWLSRQGRWSGTRPSSSAYQCPGHGRRVKGAFGVAHDRFATLDPATAPQGFGAYEGDRRD